MLALEPLLAHPADEHDMTCQKRTIADVTELFAGRAQSRHNGAAVLPRGGDQPAEDGDRLFSSSDCSPTQRPFAQTSKAVKESLKEFIRRRKTQTVLPFAGITAMVYRARSRQARSPRQRKRWPDRGRAAFQQGTASCDRVGHRRRRAEPETWPRTPEHIRTAYDRTGRGHRAFGSLTCAARWNRSPWKQRRAELSAEAVSDCRHQSGLVGNTRALKV